MVDLSWPRGMSINDGIPVNEYLGSPIDLRLPTIDFMSDRVRDLWAWLFDVQVRSFAWV